MVEKISVGMQLVHILRILYMVYKHRKMLAFFFSFEEHITEKPELSYMLAEYLESSLLTYPFIH